MLIIMNHDLQSGETEDYYTSILIMSIILSQVWRRWRGERGGKLHSGADCLCWDHILSLHFGMSRFHLVFHDRSDFKTR